MSFSNIVNQALKLADTIAPLLAGTPVGPIIAIGKGIIGLIDDLKTTASIDELPELNRRRDVLEPLVMAHLDKTIASLG